MDAATTEATAATPAAVKAEDSSAAAAASAPAASTSAAATATASAAAAADPNAAAAAAYFAMPGMMPPNAAAAAAMMMPFAAMGMPGMMPPSASAPAPAAAAAAPPAPRGGGRRKKNDANAPARFKKAPDAPRRFKSAFIIFSAQKHKEIKESHAEKGITEKTTDIAKKVSEAWRNMPPDERAIWDKKAQKDKARYEVEKSMYKGPWKIQANKRTPKDPAAPKRPMSAFLAFSNKRRAALKREFPSATNADLSKMLSKTWKDADEETKRSYTEEEAALRSKYKSEMGEWRRRVFDERKAERLEREELAMQQAELRATMPGGGMMMGMEGMDPAAAAAAMQQGMFNPFMMQQMQQNAAAAAAASGGGDGSNGSFNPMMANPMMAAQFGMQMQMAQLLGQQFMQNPAAMQQGASLGFYGQGLPGQGGSSGEAPAAAGTTQNPELAGFGSGGDAAPAASNKDEGDATEDPSMAAAMMLAASAAEGQAAAAEGDAFAEVIESHV